MTVGSAAKTRSPGGLPEAAEAGRAAWLRRRSLRAAGLALAIGLLVLAVLLSLAVGARNIDTMTVLHALFSNDGSDEALIVRTLRVPRTIVGLAVGAAIGLAGAVIQGLTRNPLADPGLLGVEAGAALSVVVAIHFFGIGSMLGYVWFGLIGAALAGALVYGLGSIGRGGATPLRLVLAGAALTMVLASFTSTLLLLDQQALDQIRFWQAGSLAGRELEVAAYVAPFIGVGVILALLSSRGLNALSLGDEVARGLGQSIARTRAMSALSIVLLCGAATAAAGPIGFVGLAVPHIARAFTGPDHRWLLPYSMVLAPAVLLLADVVGRVVLRPGELQVGIVTAVVGAPVFILLARRTKLRSL